MKNADQQVSRNDLALRIGAALAAIVSIGLVAATIRSPLETGGTGGSGGGEDGGSGVGGQSGFQSGGGESVPEFFEYLVYALLIVVAIAIAWYLLFHRRELLGMVAAVIAVVGVLVLLVWLFMELGGDPNLEPPNRSAGSQPGQGGGNPGQGERERTPISIGPLVGVLAVITAIFAGALVLTNRRSDGDELAASEESGLEDDIERAAVGEAAGRAATRIEAADDDVDNEVYRAWEEMTELLEVDRPETSTPGEFADAAIDAGLAREHVKDLTRLFEAVRYGGVETTAEMEARAVAVLREIETEYADDGDGSTDHVDGGTDGQTGGGT
ncbi:DUF4129 domain-containing protein [Halostagnicola kamekurae]|uniref:Protein-glutamine gamma-glutamyltransferase-like C-terminal domain-containing protein n=1 Tax=Halostagnicola kamekurae TaxID=619731 RepID=A0A1I6QS36_9EURY|nr:DUF4129 domain-containing protein [Halostagnicola kamekurae]SFS55220.1 protein of unknown function [Halostagnicola kamekurae]